jgi:hypothetical protein
MTKNWSLKGTYFEACNCDAACPCVFLSAPTDGECTVLIAWHIDDGRYGDVDLNGLNVAMAVHSPGHMVEVPWKAALYVDERASENQQGALTQIFAGQAGGHPARLGAHVGEVLGVTSLPMDYQAEGKERSLRIDGVAEAQISAIEGQGGGDVTVEGHPLCIAPGFPAVTAKSSKLSYSDHGQQWEISGKTGFYSPFAYSAE